MTAILIVAGFGVLALIAGAYVVGSWAGYDDGYDAGLADKREFGGTDEGPRI